MPIERLIFLAKNILFYGTGNMLYTVVMIIAMPMIIRHMSMREVANWNILLPTGVLLSALVTFGMDAAVARFIIDKDSSGKKLVFSTGLYFVFGLALLISTLLWLFSFKTLGLINLSREYYTSFLILLVWLPGTILSQFFQNWFKYTFQRKRFIQVIAFQSMLYLLTILCLRWLCAINLQNVMLAALISVWTSSFLGLIFLRKMFMLKVDRGIFSSLLIYGSPFLIMAFGFNLIFSFDKYFLSRFISQEEFAVYSQAFRIAGIFSMVVSSFNFGFGPFALSILEKEDAPETFAYLRSYYLISMCAIGAAFMATGRSIILLLAGNNYVAGNKFFPLFILGYVFYGLYSFAQLGIIRSKKSYLGLYALLFGLVSTVGLDVLTVGNFTGYGTALGFLFGNLIMFIFANNFSKKYLSINYSNARDSIIILGFIICGVASTFWININDHFLDSLYKLFVSIAVFFIIVLLPLFKTERRWLKRYLFQR